MLLELLLLIEHEEAFSTHEVRVGHTVEFEGYTERDPSDDFADILISFIPLVEAFVLNTLVLIVDITLLLNTMLFESFCFQLLLGIFCFGILFGFLASVWIDVFFAGFLGFVLCHRFLVVFSSFVFGLLILVDFFDFLLAESNLFHCIGTHNVVLDVEIVDNVQDDQNDKGYQSEV